MTDDLDPAPAVACEPASGATFPLGTTTVTCSATDAAGNVGTGSFDVHVVDSTPPALSLPADFTVDVFDPKGLSANYLATATDAVDAAPVVLCTPPSGTVPPPGQTTVECTATDAAGNASAGSFVVTVLDARQTIALLRAQIVGHRTSASRRRTCCSASWTRRIARWPRTTGEGPGTPWNASSAISRATPRRSANCSPA